MTTYLILAVCSIINVSLLWILYWGWRILYWNYKSLKDENTFNVQCMQRLELAKTLLQNKVHDLSQRLDAIDKKKNKTETFEKPKRGRPKK